MRRIMMCLMSSILMITAAAFAEDQVMAAKPLAEKSIAFVMVGPVDSALMNRVVQFAKDNTALNIHLLPAMEVAGDTLEELGIAASRAMGPQDALLVILTKPSMDIPARQVFLPDCQVVVVNVKSLHPSSGDTEIWGRRVEREVMQGIGRWLGVPPCPNPQCVMFQHKTDDELDDKGRNYCPPCLDAVHDGAKAKGVGMNEDNPLSVP